ncbi:transcription-repair coupling factor [Lachnoclostridium sp. Marseille-P6806]|uniref:transcription-repair coupling factor n=1 Tax=Lachnoclostridium sp. Marseille-P6806 TaxID=2364793 RepID=UPI0010323068|nr:transcription-repair coupling factor [Lachnoclostridium sp. Marseille-P6806]
MKTLFSPLKGFPQYEAMLASLRPQRGEAAADGCVDSQKVHLAFALASDEALQSRAKSRLFLTYSDLRAREIYDDCLLYDRNTMLFPAKDLIFYQADLRSREIEIQRLRCLRRILEGRPVTVVATFAALMTPQLPLALLRESVLGISKNETIRLETVTKRLAAMGYERNAQVDSPGQFAVRGDIVDIFDLTEDNPVRIEFWDDNIESIRSFDVLTQRRIEALELVRIYPAMEMILSESRAVDGLRRIREEKERQEAVLRSQGKTEEAGRLGQTVGVVIAQAEELRDYSGLESYIHYFYPNTVNFLDLFSKEESLLIFDEPERVREQGEAVELEFRESMSHRAEKGYILPGQMELLLSVERAAAGTLAFRRAGLCTLSSQSLFFPEGEKNTVHLRARGTLPYNGRFEALLDDLMKRRAQGGSTVILSASRTRAKRLAQELTGADVTAFFSENPDRVLAPGEIETAYGHVLHGFEYSDLKFAVITEADIFGEEKQQKKKRHRHKGAGAIADYVELRPGDYVVHVDHGIGIYRGIEKIEVEHVAKDYIRIEYGGGDILYVSPNDLEVLQKYAGNGEDAKGPRLNRLGTQEWSNTRRKVQKAVSVIADDLVELYAKRRLRSGHAFSGDSEWQREFEELFPYRETEDQLMAIAETKADMESPKIMDRLICGDVGYGKTEIAIRAAFKAVQDGYQTAVLVPTTILAQQHYNTFFERMHTYPVTIEVLSRFRSAAEVKKTLKGVTNGTVDIVIGTHRLLSKDVKFKKLGLLVIDEEQRFGVAAKEKIKQARESVDVLTLTATPIPRTLHMSLVGIRDMSILETAPGERRPIQTYVMEYNEEMIREAIVRELSRKGQVYFVHNRVNDIDLITGRLREMVPEAQIAFAHGQMKEDELERIMYDFISHRIDVLVSTTIIETGLDISNCNTIIINDADRMGLAQLYQLRGRVGRSARTAYAFLMYKKDRMLAEEAEKRLAAIREFTELGSGYRIAMRDLEIRGAGSVLGKTQSGHLMAVGYDLYCKMLNEAIRKAKSRAEAAPAELPGAVSADGEGLPLPAAPGSAPADGDERPEVQTEVKLDVDAFLPESYIVNEEQKMDIYRKIAAVDSTEDCEDMRDELTDRFGSIPGPAENLLRIALIRSVAKKLEIAEIRGYSGMIRLVPAPFARLRVENIPAFLAAYRPRLRFIAQPPEFEYSWKPSGLREKEEEMLLVTTEELLVRMSELLR